MGIPINTNTYLIAFSKMALSATPVMNHPQAKEKTDARFLSMNIGYWPAGIVLAGHIPALNLIGEEWS